MWHKSLTQNLPPNQVQSFSATMLLKLEQKSTSSPVNWRLLILAIGLICLYSAVVSASNNQDSFVLKPITTRRTNDHTFLKFQFKPTNGGKRQQQVTATSWTNESYERISTKYERDATLAMTDAILSNTNKQLQLNQGIKDEQQPAQTKQQQQRQQPGGAPGARLSASIASIPRKLSSRRPSLLRIHVTAIYVDKAEFPLSKLLFKLTLRLALKEAVAKLSQQQQQEPVVAQQDSSSSSSEVVDESWRKPDSSNNNKQAVKLTMSIRNANTCSRQYASAVAAEEYYTRQARLFIVSGCDEAIRGVARLASSWRVPIMTAAGFNADLNDKSVYRTLVRVAFSLRASVEFLFKIMKSFQWRRINLIVDESDPNSWALKQSIEKHLADYESKALGISLNVITFDLQFLATMTDNSTTMMNSLQQQRSDSGGMGPSGQYLPTSGSDDKWPNEATDRAVQAALRQSALFSRVSILLLPQQHLRRIMLSAYDQNMATGLYSFVNMPLLPAAANNDQQMANNQPVAASANYNSTMAAAGNGGKQFSSFSVATGENVFLWRSLRSTRNSHAKQAFESLMSIYLRSPTSKAYVYFANKLTNLANTDYGTATQPTSLSAAKSGQPESQSRRPDEARTQLNIDPYSASFYDCLQIYVSALNESLSSMKQSQGNQSMGQLEMKLHSRISELMKDRRYENMITGTVKLNQNGDREVDYTLDDMSQLTGRFSPVIMYRAETRQIERLGRIHWSSDSSVGPTSDTVDCNLNGTCSNKPRTKLIFVISLLAIPLGVLFGGLFYFIQNKISLESKLVDHWWRIHMNEIELITTRRKQNNNGSLIVSQNDGCGSIVSSSQKQSIIQGGTRLAPAGFDRLAVGGPESSNRTTVTRATHAGTMVSSLDVCYGNILLGMYKLSRVALKPICRFHTSRKLMIELRTIRDINHHNLCRFVGIVVDEGSMALVTEFCPKGSLREFFYNESMVIDWTFKYSIINDIMAGLLYIHSSQLGFHGRLKSSNCLVSARFVIKLSDYGPHSLYEQLDSDESDELAQLKKRIWLAPEHMKSSGSKIGSPRGDIYSFGLLLFEIITNKLPFYDQENDDYIMPLKSLVKELKNNGPSEKTGPDLSSIDVSISEGVDIQPLVNLMESCWHLDPSKRPDSAAVGAAIKKITKGVTSKKLLENLTTRMEQYTNNLESLVDTKLAFLVEEKLKTEELLYQFVPKSIAYALKEGQTIEPEAFDCVTVFYSDIVGFTSLSSESSPMEVVDFLSDLYLCFDETLEQHDIYKVDTIGDAYIVASGLPIRNDGKHVVEIACAALELRDRLSEFRIPHKPGRALEMRVGIHSGPCIAGIVGGLNMPKYCVFGDTLTTGKFMESSGLPMKIHITEESRRLLDGVQGFTIEPRQPRIVKDGLPFQTYWLEKQQ